MYSKKLFGINTLSCSEGSMGLRPEWPWTARRKRISCPDGSLQYWNLFLIPPPPAILLFHFSSDQCRECTRSFRRYSFFSRIQSLHHLLEVDHHDESDMRISSWLSKGKGKGKDVQGEGKGKDGKNESFKKAKSDTQRKCFYCNKSGLACPKYLAAQCCGSAFPENGLASLQDHDKVEVTLVDWERGIVHCVLIQLPENLSNHSYNWLHSVVPEFWPWIH